MLSGSRLSLFGRLRDYRSLSALLASTVGLTARTAARETSPTTFEVAESPPCDKNTNDEGKILPQDESRSISDQPAGDTAHDLLLAHFEQKGEDGDEDARAELESANDADLQLLQLLESDRLDPISANSPSTLRVPQNPSAAEDGRVSAGAASTQPPSSGPEESVAVLGRLKLPVDSRVSGCEVLAALEGLARGQLWLSPFWGTEGRLPDTPEAAADAELLNLLEEEEDTLVSQSYANLAATH